MPPPPLFAMRGGSLVALANAGYTVALLADVVAARARTPPPQLLLTTLTRCVHVGAWLAFVVAIAPRVRNVRHVRSLLLGDEAAAAGERHSSFVRSSFILGAEENGAAERLLGR